jgi:hypothetical protein
MGTLTGGVQHAILRDADALLWRVPGIGAVSRTEALSQEEIEEALAESGEERGADLHEEVAQAGGGGGVLGLETAQGTPAEAVASC